MDLLRFTTAGSVDDGKSTLIGRLLYDAKSIFEDQYDAIERASSLQGDGEVNLAYLTDGLRAEREQGITIDVAYRYFATPRRKFIIADTPGHEQYTRNMVTGASTAELAVVLIDARNGVLTQSRRHGFIASLLQIPHMLVTVNKMDLVDYSEERFREIVDAYEAFAEQLEIEDVVYIPVSALDGDNVVEKSTNMPWYNGPTLFHHLENVKTGASRNVVDFRFPVQYVIRPHQDFRGYAGQVVSGTIHRGEDVVALPSGRGARVHSIVVDAEEREQAGPGDSAILTLDDEIDVSRGDMIVRARNRPTVESRLDADLCWMADAPLREGKSYVLQHTTRRAQAYVSKVVYRLDVDTLHRERSDAFHLNDIGRVELASAEPLAFDSYRVNRHTGSFILIDPDTNATVGAGMIRGVAQGVPAFGVATRAKDTVPHTTSPNVVWQGRNVRREEREQRQGHQAAVVWLTGLSASGKSTIAKQVERHLFESGCRTMLLDGDNVRHGLCSDLAFSPTDRRENIRRIGEVAHLFFQNGCITLCSFISPYQQDRDFARSLVPEGRFFEVHVDCDVETCRQRDPKGLYERALAGEIRGFTGVSAPYEAPRHPELVVDTRQLGVDEGVEEVMQMLREAQIIS